MKRFAYMFIGGVIALVLAFGGYAAFAQNDTASPAVAAVDNSPVTESVVAEVQAAVVQQVQDDTEDTDTEDDAAAEDADSDDSALPGFGGFFGRFGESRGNGIAGDGDEYMAEALGITVEELEAAHVTAITAALEQAVAEGLLTQEEADAILANGVGTGRMHMPLFASETIDFNALLADALGITVDELNAARQEAAATKLAQMVADGVITQEQADAMLENMATFGFGPFGHGGFGPGDGTGFGPCDGTGFGPGDGSGFGPGDGTGFGPGDGTGFGPGDGTGFGPGNGTGAGAGFGPGNGNGNGNNAGGNSDA